MPQRENPRGGDQAKRGGAGTQLQAVAAVARQLCARVDPAEPDAHRESERVTQHIDMIAAAAQESEQAYAREQGRPAVPEPLAQGQALAPCKAREQPQGVRRRFGLGI